MKGRERREKIDDGWLEEKEALADELNSTRNDATSSCRIYFIWKSEINCDVMGRDATRRITIIVTITSTSTCSK